MLRTARVPLSCTLAAVALAVACDPDLEPLRPTTPAPPVVPPAPVFIEKCETVAASETDVTPEALLVLDRSGSMNDVAPEFLDTRWNAVVSAVSTMTAEHEADTAFGLMLFPSPRVADVCAPGDVIIPPRLGSATQIASTFNFTSPGGATPTAGTLRAALDYFDDRIGAQADVPTAVILATDGGPNCNPFLDNETCRCVVPDACAVANPAPADEICLDDDATIAAADELHAHGVSTYVIGIPGSEEFATVLDEIAIAGGTARPIQAGRRYYPATDAASLAAALDAVTVRVEKCQRVVTLEDEATSGLALKDAESVSVALGGEPIERDDSRTEGWAVSGDNRIELFGNACERAVEGAVVDVAVCHVVEDTSSALAP